MRTLRDAVNKQVNQEADKDEKSMVNWQITAASLICEDIGEEVTIIVSKDWSVVCTGQKKHSKSGKQPQRGGCTGLKCRQITQYKEKLLSEEREG